MKTKVIKRVIAFALATLIILGTLGYFFSMVAWAAEVSLGTDVTGEYAIKNNPTKISKTEQVEITITATAKNSAATTLDGATISLDTNNSKFTGQHGSDPTISKNPDGKFTITFPNLTYADNTGKKLAFVAKKSGSPDLPMSLDITECVLASTDNNDDDDDNNNIVVPPSPSNMSYTISRVYNGTDQGNYEKATFIPGDDNKKDPSINRNQYVNVQVQFSISGVKEADVLTSEPKVQVLVDRGSFKFRSATDATITIDKVQETTGGVTCWVTLTLLQYTGTGNTLAFTVRSKDMNTKPYIYAQFSTTVDSCVPYVYTPDNDDDGKPDYSDMQMATPYVIVSNYSYGGTVTAGQTFPLSITLYNTSRNIDVTNMMVTITMPEALMLTSSSNTFYIDHLDTESSVSQTVQVTAKVNAAPQSHNIDISMKYQYIDDHLVSRRDNSTQETISIPVVQIDRFQVTGVDAPAEAYLGEENYLTVNFVNKGRSDVYNLSAEISGDIQNPGQQQNLGNLTSGSTGSAEFTILPNGEGVCNGEIKIIYEDTNMEEKTATILWSTTVVDPSAGMEFPGGMGDFDPGMMDDPSLMDEGEKKPSWPFIAGGVAVAALVVGLLVRRHILKKRSEEEDANL